MRRIALAAVLLGGCHRNLDVCGPDGSDCVETPDGDPGADVLADSAAYEVRTDANEDETTLADTTVADADVSEADAPSGDAEVSVDADTLSDVSPDTLLCASGEHRCSGDVLSKCATDGKSWGSVTTCPSGTCNAALGRCTACVPGAFSCSGAARQQCSALGVWTTAATCATPELCSASTGATCATPACSVGAKTCSGKTARTCNTARTGWTDVSCRIGCAAGECLSVIDMPIEFDQHLCVALSNGSVRCWGQPFYRATGDAPLPHDAPVPISGISTAVQVSTSGSSSGVRLADGSLRWWGRLYTPTSPGSVDSAVPLSIPGMPTGLTLMIGSQRVCAIQADTTLKCYGQGPLGDGTFSGQFTTPKPVPGLTGVRGGTITDLFLSAFAIVDGGAAGWGSNQCGQLGIGVKGEKFSPTSTFGFATQVSSRNCHACAVLATGGLRCAGGNDLGQLGNGTKVDSLVPVDVSGLSSGVRNVCSGQDFSCAALADKTVRCWGHNGDGQLGDGTITDSTVPVKAVLPAAVKVGCGYISACALLEDGDMQCWGGNDLGQLGIGTRVPAYKATPTAVAW